MSADELGPFCELDVDEAMRRAAERGRDSAEVRRLLELVKLLRWGAADASGERSVVWGEPGA